VGRRPSGRGARGISSSEGSSGSNLDDAVAVVVAVASFQSCPIQSAGALILSVLGLRLLPGFKIGQAARAALTS
jgi:hypothetical protein